MYNLPWSRGRLIYHPPRSADRLMHLPPCPVDRPPTVQRRVDDHETVRPATGTARQATETMRGSLEFELAWRRAIRRMREQGFTRDAVDEMAKALGQPPLTDEEWADTNEPR